MSISTAPIAVARGELLVPADNLKSYFEKARRFDQDRMMQVERSNRIAWWIAIVSSIVEQ